jgi:hypothetical protein
VFPNVSDLTQGRQTLISGRAPDTEDRIIEELPADLRFSPISIAVTPDGMTYWIDAQRNAALYAMTPDGTLTTIALPKALHGPVEIATAANGLALRIANGTVFAIESDALTFGTSAETREKSYSLEAREVRQLTTRVGDTPMLYGLRGDGRNSLEVINGANAPAVRGLPGELTDLAVDPDGFVMAISDNGRSIYGAFSREKVTRVARSALASESPEVNALLGLPEDRFGSASSIAAVGPGRFVITDTASGRLSVIERDGQDGWVLRRFDGTQPTAVSASPLSQRTEQPTKATAAPDGSIMFVTEGSVLRRMLPNGTIRTIAGGGQQRPTAFSRPAGVTLFAANRSQKDQPEIVVVDEARHRVMAIDQTGALRLIAGSGVAGQALNDLDSPTAVVASDGELFVADSGNHRIISIDGSGLVRVLAGTGVAGVGAVPAPAASVELNNPTAVAVTEDGRLVIADMGNNRVLMLNSDGTLALLFTIGSPSGLAAIGSERVLVSSQRDGQIFSVDLRRGTAQVLAGQGVQGYQGDGGPAVGARLSGPSALAVGPDGSVWVCDAGNGAIRRITPTGIISTVVGGDGTLPALNGITIDSVYGLLFTATDGRLFSVNVAELDEVTPGWSTKP